MRVGPFGTMELIIILAIVLIIFGVGKVPQIGGAIGKGIREFRRSVSGDAESQEGSEKDGDPGQQGLI
jgi:sec-independent protein translocase protein TatA